MVEEPIEDQVGQEQVRLDQAMQRADDMLVASLRRDDGLRRYRTAIAVLSLLVIALAGALVWTLVSNRSPQATSVAGADAPNPEVLMEQGWQLWQQRSFASAERKFDEAVKGDPKLVNAWNGLGWSRFNGGKTASAIEAFNKVVELDPNHPAGLNGLGQAYYLKNDFAKAEPLLLKAAANNASAAWWGLAKLYLLQGKWADAEKWAQKIVTSGDATGQPMLDAAKAKALPDELKQMISPPA
jgi:Flp pilus assembly protein TadD